MENFPGTPRHELRLWLPDFVLDWYEKRATEKLKRRNEYIRELLINAYVKGARDANDK